MGRITQGALCALVAVGCAGGPPAVRAVPPAQRARSDDAVVYLSTDCSGVLVGARAVLTAAHCVEEPGPWWVRVDGRARGRELRRVTRCRTHPRAYEAPRACGAGAGQSAPAHDLAVLELDRDVTVAAPLEVHLAPPSLEVRWWRTRRVRLVGWDRRPQVVGPLARREGPNRIVALESGLLVTEPPSRGGFATTIGDSGGPALLHDGARERVAGLLWGGPAPVSPRSVYTTTFDPENARWLLSAIGGAFARDLGHLDPEQPFDRADYSELAASRWGLGGRVGVTSRGWPR